MVLLIEQTLTEADAARICSLHEAIPDPVTYRVLLPQEDAAAQVQAALGGLRAGEMGAVPAAGDPQLDPEALDAVQQQATSRAQVDLATSLAALRAVGATATGEVVAENPMDALARAVRECDGREAIVVTSPHVVAEFFHVDWTHQARRRLDVPVLHLVEHETFDEQAGDGEGISGF